MEQLDLDAYLARIGYAGPRDADVSTLRALHRAHRGAIAFENVRVATRREVSLDLTDIQEKMVKTGQGGYCFEHNLLFAAALERFGFPVTRLLARVRRGSSRTRHRGHALLVVGAGYELWVADVGFGAEGLIDPIGFSEGERVKAGDWVWRLSAEADQWILQIWQDDDWFDLYAFRVEQHHPVDFDMSNYFTAHHRTSTFTGRLIAQRGTEHVRNALTDRKLVSWYADGRTEKRELTDENVLAELRDTFGIHLPDHEERLLRERFLFPHSSQQET